MAALIGLAVVFLAGNQFFTHMANKRLARRSDYGRGTK